MKHMVGLAVALLIMAATVVMAEDDHAHVAPKASEALERMKAMVGRWEGTAAMEDGKTAPAVIEYRLTSGGTAVVETMEPGTEHEMVSVYHDDGGALAMTHYCMLGNQPVLKLTGAEPSQMTFSLDGTRGIGSAQDMHMHALTLTWAGPDEFTQTWTSYNEGRPVGTTMFSLSRAGSVADAVPN